MIDRMKALTPRIVVLGVGGAGSNAVGRMVAAGVKGVEFVALNTDKQALANALASRRVQIGEHTTHGLGTGGDASVGAAAAQETGEEIRAICRAADMVFVTAGMGGGTGSGAAPVIAQIARDTGALTVGVVTRPFSFEGTRRQRNAEQSIEALRERVHTLIAIPNDRVLQVIDRRTSMELAFVMVDEVLRQCIQGISDLVTEPGLINLDFADVRSVMSEPGAALMAVGIATGENRAVEAARLAMTSPLLDLSMEGARGVLFNITGGPDLTLQEVHSAAEIVGAAADPDANIFFGAVIDEAMGADVRITVIATGFEPTRWTGDRAGRQTSWTATDLGTGEADTPGPLGRGPRTTEWLDRPTPPRRREGPTILPSEWDIVPDRPA
ncbi:MAG: cell division protein FtsZ [Chloroflexi bacterium]|nr:cell division protein FtsZ [Chloroflexota bacterium]